MHQSSKRQQSVQKARRAVCGGVVLLLLLQLAGLFVIEFRRPDLADPEFGLRLRSFQRRSAESPDRPVLAIVGSSRASCGIDTEAMSRPLAEGGLAISAANLSLAGGTSLWQHLIVRRLSHFTPTPQRVVLELFPASFLGGDNEYFSETYQFPTHRQRYCDLAVLDELLPEQSARHRSQWWWNNGFLPLRTHGTALWNSLLPLFKTDDLFLDTRAWKRRLTPTGQAPWDVPHPTADQRVKAWSVAEKEYAKLLREGQVDRRSCEVYRRTLAWCQTHGIEVAALVMMPESPRFRGWYSEANWNATSWIAEELAEDFSVRLIDAREWVPDEDSFADGHHLLPEAARQFTIRLGMLVEPGNSPPSDDTLQSANKAELHGAR